MSLFNVVSINLYYFGESYIVEGKFDRVLLRPVHSLFQVMSEQFRLESLSDTAVGLFIVFYTSRELGLQYGPGDWAFLVATALCGLVIYLSVFLMLTCVSFWVEDRVGIIPPVYNMLAFGRYPLNIYSPFVQFPAQLDHPVWVRELLSFNGLAGAGRVPVLRPLSCRS